MAKKTTPPQTDAASAAPKIVMIKTPPAQTPRAGTAPDVMKVRKIVF